MVKKFIPLFLLLVACNDSHSFKKAEDAEDAGREFIRASLDGNYEKASFYLYADSTNKMMLAKWKKDYDHLDPEDQQKYKEASIMVINISPLNDSVTDFTYLNSFKKDTTTIRIVKQKGDWFVDLEEILYHYR